jgi:hypothetical protein
MDELCGKLHLCLGRGRGRVLGWISSGLLIAIENLSNDWQVSLTQRWSEGVHDRPNPKSMEKVPTDPQF